jgi:GT2 family glycosyltransferase
MTVVRWANNRGSSAGFAKGIETALKSDCTFIWILDDDNQPQAGALDCLQRFWRERSRATTDRRAVALTSFRKDRPNFVQALVRGIPSLIYPPMNSFAGFHLAGLWGKLRERLWRAAATAESVPVAGRLDACAYGGLYCHRDLLLRIGLPDPAYVLYADDFAYTRQITTAGGEIWLLRDSEIVDLESSDYLPTKKSLLYHSVFDSRRDAAVYYGFRNTIYFGRRYRVDSPGIYLVNKILFLTLMLAMGLLRGQGHRIRVLWQAMHDGECGHLGYREQYPL